MGHEKHAKGLLNGGQDVSSAMEYAFMLFPEFEDAVSKEASLDKKTALLIRALADALLDSTIETVDQDDYIKTLKKLIQLSNKLVEATEDKVNIYKAILREYMPADEYYDYIVDLKVVPKDEKD